MLSVPLAAFVQRDAFATKYVQSAADCEVDFAVAQMMHELKVLDTASAASVGDRNGANGCKMTDQLAVDTSLEPFCIRRMNEEFAAVRLEHRYVVCGTI